MTEAIKSKEKRNSFKEFLEEFKSKTALKIKKILSWEKPDGRNQFYKEYKYRFAQLNLDEQLWIYFTLEKYLNSECGKYPYEELTERIKPFLEEDESEQAQRVLDLIINEDIFKEDGYEFWFAMRKAIAENSEHYTKTEYDSNKEKVLKKINWK